MEKPKFMLNEDDKQFVKDFAKALFCALITVALFKLLQITGG